MTLARGSSALPNELRCGVAARIDNNGIHYRKDALPLRFAKCALLRIAYDVAKPQPNRGGAAFDDRRRAGFEFYHAPRPLC